jgi:predicted nucleic acid-binding protein
VTTLIDSTIWSLALRRTRRRRSAKEEALVHEWRRLIVDGDAAIIGPIRQEVLTGIQDDAAFERIRSHLAGFDDVRLERDDFELAARFANQCLDAGIAGAHTDLLICAAAERRGLDIFTTDRDFVRYGKVLPIVLHAV